MTPGAAVDRRWMALALREGDRGRPSPRRRCGAVIVRAGEVVGKGHHESTDGAEASTVAIRMAGDRARGATLYLTSAPDEIDGSPEEDLGVLREAELHRMVVGSRGRGEVASEWLARLRAENVLVEVGVREDECRRQNADLEKHRATGLPLVVLKAAVTLDGRMATRTGESKWITGPSARREAHRLRAQSDAVMVGVGTVLADDPELTVRSVPGSHPRRIVLDSSLRTPVGAKVLAAPGDEPTILVHGPRAEEGRRRALRAAGAELLEVGGEGTGLDLRAVLIELGRRGMIRLLVEGGPRLSASFFDAGLADEAAVFVAPCILGDASAPSFVGGEGVHTMAAAARLDPVRIRRLGKDVLITGTIARERREV